ncbi:hypothetical protein G3O00_01630 [Burkholderia sp. Ac-20384]|uniref:hypothetical protein n=1 Tax=Burkholderia sp. Ac-20384 TaxID=2703902 RepID=UPI00198075C0|nr:hypothetical protein [Burkholderia sp. Ac-20384]MBN3822319.1 hypothetical protein [Burkholderia sp. Ac-20384]
MTTQLTLADRAKVALRTADCEPALAEMVRQSADVTEIKNADGRTQVHGMYMVLKKRRTDIRGAGKDARDDATKFSTAIIAEENRLVALIEPEEKRLQALRDAWDTARENERREKAATEQRRKDGIRAKIDELRAVPLNLMDAPTAKIADALEDMETFDVTADVFAEFVDAAITARAEVVAKLTTMRAAAVARDAEAARVAAERAELAKQRAEQEERERQAAAELVRQREEQAERDRQAVAARAEQERLDRERREAAEAQARAEREAEQRKLDEQKAEIARQQAEIAAERQRIADEEASRLRAEEAVAAAKRHAAEEAAEAARREEAARHRAEQEKADRAKHAAAEIEASKRRVHEQEQAAIRDAAPAMLEALENLLDRYVGLASSGDAGNWDFESEPQVIAARAAIALARQAEAQEVAA